MPQKLFRQIGERVRTYRKLRRLTQDQLSERADLSPHYLSRVETGRAAVTLESLARLAKALDVQIEELFQFRRREEEDTKALIQENLALLKGRTPKELRMFRSLIRQIAEVLPPTKRT